MKLKYNVNAGPYSCLFLSFSSPLSCFENWLLDEIKRLKHQEGRIKGAVATSAGSLAVPKCWMDLEHAFKCQGGNNPNIKEMVLFVQLLRLATPQNERVILPELILA